MSQPSLWALPSMALRLSAKMRVMDTERRYLAGGAHCFLQGKAEHLLPELVERVEALLAPSKQQP